MRIEIPREVERFGPIMFHDVQKVYELDAGLKLAKNEGKENSTIVRLSYESVNAIEQQMVIVVPVMEERIKLIEGVLCGIPNDCLTIVVSNSPREPIDRFYIEKDAIEHAARFMNKKILVVHQKDPLLAKACIASGYKYILDKENKVMNGKAEGMILGTILANLTGRKYIGFIDSDNFFPGAVLEYVKEYCAGFLLAKSRYSMVRISWHSKPKIVQSNLFFAKRGRASEYTNRILNSLISQYTGYGTEIIKTGNAGEHAMSMDLAAKLDFSSGYSIEPYHYINMLERFGGIVGNPEKDVMKNRIELFQIESRNPHLHEVKGDVHVQDMSRAAMEVIYRSPICPESLKKEILNDLYNRKLLKDGEKLPETLSYYPAICNADLKKFAKTLENHEYAKYLKATAVKKVSNETPGLMREKIVDTGELPPDQNKILEMK
ncbi:mannosyl-3-phosphoglycerate synthase [Tunicatimonas pelagia]|uniref:mannosyl-3-phosphoglycerate synthase n=1 Tax=Tunicatimonas pelagia TaxID=931531 RepID=UPI00266708F3|nr:mannosyl-3-phosphoglycerate synthase [Tunicatimonas pelagia]WKN43224.1 mannosyl-3-phosphoglycerate synthase [Tunicatimonas pelagia]